MTVLKPVRRLTLVSSSPRRKELLAGLVQELRIVEPDCDEISVRKPADALANALQKLMSALPRPSELAVAADTAVFLDGKALGKPTDAEDAKRMLRALSGRWHEVSTGLAVGVDGVVETAVVTTKVLFRSLDDVEIDAYVATGEPLDKAGAYGIQGLGGLLVERVDGDRDNVIGLPVQALRDMLAKRGYILDAK